MKILHLVLLAFLLNSAWAERPNILFIAIDDMNDWTGFLGGHPQAITPNMDELAKKGVNFTNAHCPAPGCSPSRNALLYGIEPFNSGLYAFYDQDKLPEGFIDKYQSIPQFFKANGYETYGSGKIHHRRKETSEEWTDFVLSKHKSPLVHDDEAGYSHPKGSNKVHFSPTLNSLEDHRDYRNTTFGVEVLEQEHEKPFFLAVGLIKPHLQFEAPKQFFDLYPEEVQAPKILETDLDDVPPVGESFVNKGDDRRFKRDKAWTQVRRAYLACISWVDYNVGRLLDALEASPYADNTIVVLWSDHGYGMGEKNHFRKFALWEEVTRVPYIIWDTRDKSAPKGREVKEGVSIINTYQTLADLSGLDAPGYVDGFSLAPQLKNPSKALEGPAICTWGRGNYTVRTRDWRYIRYYDGTEELYDHKKDPDEWTNLAENPEFAEIKRKLEAQLPVNEAKFVKKGLEKWSVAASADKPLKN